MKNKKTKYIVLIILGAIICAASFVVESYAGLAIAFILRGLGTLTLVIGLIQLKLKSEKHKVKEIEENDERNLAIRGQAAHITNVVTAVCLVFVCICCLMIEQFIIAAVLGGFLVMLIATHLISKAIYSSKM